MPEDDIKLVGNLEIHNKEKYVIVSCCSFLIKFSLRS